MTHHVAVWREREHVYEDTFPSNWVKGDKTPKKNVQYILRSLMTFEVQASFNLNGTNREEVGKADKIEKKSFLD